MRIGRTIEEINQGLAKQCPTYCPKCAHSILELYSHPNSFDEEGWYTPIEIICTNKACKHTWVHRIPLAVASSNGNRHSSQDDERISW